MQERKQQQQENKAIPYRRSGSRKDAITVILLKKAKEKGHWPEYWLRKHKRMGKYE